MKKALLVLALLIVAVPVAGYFYLQSALERSKHDPSILAQGFSEVASLPDYAATSAPCRDTYPQRKAWFGALHIHTAASFDATAFGVTNTVDDAYAFSRGEPVEYRLRRDPPGAEVPLVTPRRALDFAAVTDHAGQLGEKRICYNPDMPGYGAFLCHVYRGDWPLSPQESTQALLSLASQAIFGSDRSARVCGEDGQDCRDEARTAWGENREAAERWQDTSADCSFTTFPGYEYTLAMDASNLHRNVIFANAAVPPAVVSAKEIRSPEELWRWLRRHCNDTDSGCDALTIAHNSNWSSGRIWYPYSYRDDMNDDTRLDTALLRQQMEPLVEIMQVKGDSECRNGLSTVYGAPDEFCDFEKLRAPSEAIEDCGEAFSSGNMRLVGCLSRFSYARYALSTGLEEEKRYGVNPFKLGIVAATDNHNGTATADTESHYMGSTGLDRSVQNRLRGGVEVPGGIAKGDPVRYGPGGVAGVWAEENSRASLFAAMRRRETFGTSGPRIEPRFFGGWELDPSMCESPDMVSEAYATAVPMGSDLPGPDSGNSAPEFLVSAARDPQSHLLQRIQVIKGWTDEEGRTHQAVYDVAGNPENGATVDVDSCQVSGGGYNQLCKVWRDPDFDPGTSAVYYARVLENPSCRWSTFQCNALPEAERPESCSNPELARKIQERAWTSPIWYSAPPRG